MSTSLYVPVQFNVIWGVAVAIKKRWLKKRLLGHKGGKAHIDDNGKGNKADPSSTCSPIYNVGGTAINIGASKTKRQYPNASNSR
ncbi:MAG: hypothetical protein OXD29_03370 [Roseovarius sp.]|nr:hypothetical protein [Roseovarius sp.]